MLNISVLEYVIHVLKIYLDSLQALFYCLEIFFILPMISILFLITSKSYLNLLFFQCLCVACNKEYKSWGTKSRRTSFPKKFWKMPKAFIRHPKTKWGVVHFLRANAKLRMSCLFLKGEQFTRGSTNTHGLLWTMQEGLKF